MSRKIEQKRFLLYFFIPTKESYLLLTKIINEGKVIPVDFSLHNRGQNSNEINVRGFQRTTFLNRKLYKIVLYSIHVLCQSIIFLVFIGSVLMYFLNV